MKRIGTIVVSVLMTALFLSSTVAYSVDISPGELNDPLERINQARPSIDISDENHMIMTFMIGELVEKTLITEQGTFTLLTVPDMGYIKDIGKPQLPYSSELLAVPNTDVTIEVLEQKYYDLGVGTIYPAQEPEPESYAGFDSEFVLDEELYSKDAYYPDETISIVDTGKIRAIPFTKIGFCPVQYNPVAGNARVTTLLQVKISWNPNINFEVENRHKSQYYDLYYGNCFINWQPFQEAHASELEPVGNGPRSPTGCEYLIITDFLFIDAANALKTWKMERGIDTRVVTTMESGSGGATLEDYIQNAFNTWDPAPSYILFLGDAEHIEPTYYNIHPYHGTLTGTDLWYMCVIGPDYYPDIFHGRIPVDTVSDANNYIQKIIDYETDPPYHSGYYNNVTVAAYFQDDENDGYETRRFVRTSEEVRDFLLLNLTDPYNVLRIYCTEPFINPTNYNNGPYGNGEPIPWDLQRPFFAWEGDATDIKNRLDNGTFILNHRDHGSRGGWGDPFFQIPEIGTLDNGELLPVVFSINCATGWFDHETDSPGDGTSTECFCEEFVRKVDGGTVCIFGASRVSYSGYNDFLCRGFYDAMWPGLDPFRGGTDPMHRMGEVLNYGKSYMTSTWGDPWGREELTFELFHCFGDPTMEIWTAEPQDLVVSHPATLVLDTTQVVVNVNEDDALVCLVKDGEIIGTNYSSGGDATIDVSPLPLGVVNVTVTKHNFRPYRGNITVIPPGDPPWVDLTSPDGGELWKGGSLNTIWWEMGDGEDDIGDLTVDLYYSTDGGFTYPNTIATGLTGFVSSPCDHDWDPVPFIDSSDVKVRVDVVDTHMMTAADFSLGVFSIDSTAPQPATNAYAELTGTNDVTIFWDSSPSTDVDHYEVWYRANIGWHPNGDGYVFRADVGLNTNYVDVNTGKNSGADYWWQIRTYDVVDHETRTIQQAAKVGSVQNAAVANWHLCGSGLVRDYSLANVLQGFGLPGNYRLVRTYDGLTDTWKTSINGHPHTPLTQITDVEGFWMYISATTRFAAAGYIDDKVIDLYEGWNLVAYPFATGSMTSGDIMTHLAANCPNYDSMLIAGDPFIYPMQLRFPDGTETIQNSMGFWVKVTADTTWTVTNY